LNPTFWILDDDLQKDVAEHGSLNKSGTSHIFVMITFWLFNIAMENCPFIDDLPINNGDFPWRTVK